MPKVGKKSFPYTPEGKKAAKKYAKERMTDIHGIGKSSKSAKSRQWRRSM